MGVLHPEYIPEFFVERKKVENEPILITFQVCTLRMIRVGSRHAKRATETMVDVSTQNTAMATGKRDQVISI